jgi:hypothetical protein
MKLSTLLLLLTASSVCLAQSAAKPPQVVIVPAPNANDATASAQDQRALQGLSKDELEQKLQAMVERSDQAGCPVKLTSAELTPYLLLLQTSNDAPATHGSLDLQFQNASGKGIRSMEFDVQFLARKSIYDLKAVKIDLHLSASGTRSLDKTFDHLRHLPLPLRTNPVVLNTITLEQVTFADGSVWTPEKDNNCDFSPSREMQVGAR